jgi:hypothetical protein
MEQRENNLTYEQTKERNMTYAQVIQFWKPDATEEEMTEIYLTCHDKAYKQAVQGRRTSVPASLVFDVIKYDYFKEINCRN